jgi:hypothetical protein
MPTDDFKGLREAVRRHRAKKDCEFDINDIAALLAELDRVRGERDAMLATLPGPIYMDPPDGGDVSPAEQMKRMADDAARYRWLVENDMLDMPSVDIANAFHRLTGDALDAAIDAARGKGKEG